MKPDDLSADEVRSLLNLEPNATCGFVRVTYVSKQNIAPGGLPAPFAGGSPLGSALYFMVTPTAPVRLHRIKNDQLYHYYLGDPLQLFLLHADGFAERVVVGPDLRAGQRIQLLIPAYTFHTARVIGSRTLVSRREHRVAWSRARRRRNRQARGASAQISERRFQLSRHRRIGARHARLGRRATIDLGLRARIFVDVA